METELRSAEHASHGSLRDLIKLVDSPTLVSMPSHKIYFKSS